MADSNFKKSLSYKHNIQLLDRVGDEFFFLFPGDSHKRRAYMLNCAGCDRDFFSRASVAATCSDECRAISAQKKRVGTAEGSHYRTDVPGGAVYLKTPCEKTYAVDNRDLDSILRYRWQLDKDGYIVTAFSDHKAKKKVHIKLHRLIMGARPGELVDHIDRNPQNNLKENLRITTKGINSLNCEKARGGMPRNISRFKGGYMFRIKITIAGKPRTFSRQFKTIAEAVAFKDAHKNLFIESALRDEFYRPPGR
jgi:hypothetical protein